MYIVLNLHTGKKSDKRWKTYAGASKNCQSFEIAINEDSLEWIERHPEWVKERLTQIKISN